MAPRYKIWPFEPLAFLNDTQHLAPTERDAYFLLLCHYWLNGVLPDDERELARIAGTGLRTWARWIRPHVAPFFYNVGKPGGWKHRRTERDLAQAAAFRVKQRRAANARWHGHGPVDNGERRGAHDVSRTPNVTTNENNGLPDATGYAVAMPLKSKITTSPFGSGGSADVDKRKNLAQTSAVVSHGNDPKHSPQSAAYQRAHHSVMRSLVTDLGKATAAKIIEAIDPDLMHRATVAEQRKPNSGACVVVTELQRRAKVL